MITLQVHGRKMIFSEEELTSILEKHFSREAIIQENRIEVAPKPTEGKWFKVNPLDIDQRLFKKVRRDAQQEATRKIILEAFEEMKKNPKYQKPFKTMIPEKSWRSKTVIELKALAGTLGDNNADWVEQALEWAQRIANGETWRDVCNKEDIANWYRLVIWKKGYCYIVGGSRNDKEANPASYVYYGDFNDFDNVAFTVPLVVSYK